MQHSVLGLYFNASLRQCSSHTLFLSRGVMDSVFQFMVGAGHECVSVCVSLSLLSVPHSPRHRCATAEAATQQQQQQQQQQQYRRHQHFTVPPRTGPSKDDTAAEGRRTCRPFPGSRHQKSPLVCWVWQRERSRHEFCPVSPPPPLSSLCLC